MKGLLLKDFYSCMAHLKAFLLLCLVFIAGAAVDRDNSFFLYYPCIMSGMVTMTLIAYDEGEGWQNFCTALPCSAAMAVSSKYLVGLILTGITAAVTLVSQGLAMALTGGVEPRALAALVGQMIPLALIPGALLLPFIYRFGSKKGRVAYYMILGGFCALIALANTGDALDKLTAVTRSPGVLLILSAGAYGLSWWLSVQFYKKRIRS